MGIVPSAVHLVHMPGHIWFTLGDYETAAAVNERAAQLDLKYLNDSGGTGSARFGYYVHNLHFIQLLVPCKADCAKQSAPQTRSPRRYGRCLT